jgi:hypothetical protein
MELTPIKYAFADAKISKGLSDNDYYIDRLKRLINKKGTWITGAELDLRRDIDEFLNNKEKHLA